jgi:hypothetical protein
VIGHRDVLLYGEQATQLPREPGCEPWILVAYYLGGQSVVTEHLLQEQLGRPFCCDGFSTGYKSYHLSTAVIRHSED